LDRARHVCAYCGRIINVTKGLSHAFPLEGKKYCTWCYFSLFFSDRSVAFALPYQEFLKRADPKFIEEALQRAKTS
jgi:hypothetical protein